MLEVLDKMEAVMPEKVIPMRDDRVVMQIGQMYSMGGRPEEFERRLKEIVARNHDFAEAYGYLVALYQRKNEYGPAIQVLDDWLKYHPQDKEAMAKREELQNLAAAKVDTTTPAFRDSVK